MNTTVQEEEIDLRSNPQMTPKTRLRLIAIMIMLSAIYAVLIVADRDLAGVIAVGYIAVILTVFVVVNAWKRDV